VNRSVGCAPWSPKVSSPEHRRLPHFSHLLRRCAHATTGSPLTLFCTQTRLSLRTQRNSLGSSHGNPPSTDFHGQASGRPPQLVTPRGRWLPPRVSKKMHGPAPKNCGATPSLMKLQAKHSAAAAGRGKITIAHFESSTWHPRRAGVHALTTIRFPRPRGRRHFSKVRHTWMGAFAKVSFGLFGCRSKVGLPFRTATQGYSGGCP
jgi:hypothetical protein